MTPAQRPVLLIHGIDDTARVFEPMVAYLREHTGVSVIHALNLQPNNGDAGLEVLAAQVKAYVDTHLAAAVPIDLIGFSMGGLVSRYYVQRLGGLQQVHHLITLSAPHHGTWLAYGRHNVGARQMRPGSAFLQDLNSTLSDLQPVYFTSIWTPFDLMIIPASSSRLPVGQEHRLPVLAHPLMLRDRRSLAAIADCLTASPPA